MTVLLYFETSTFQTSTGSYVYNAHSKIYADLVYDLNLTQLVCQPTHTRGSILDKILTNFNCIHY